MKYLIFLICLVWFWHPAHTTIAGDISSELAVHFSFEEGRGTRILDHSGEGHHGAISGSPDWVKGVVGAGALSFDGKNTYLRILNKQLPQLSDQFFTVSFWIRTLSPSKDQTIFQISGSRNRGWALGITKDGKISFSGVGIKNSYGASAGGVVTDMTWHMITLIRNKSDYLLYVDGISNKLLEIPDKSAIREACSMTIGVKWSINDCNLKRIRAYYSYEIDDVRLYRRALSAEDVKALFELRNSSEATVVDGKCSSAYYGCLSGLSKNVPDSFSDYRWQCTGTNSGKNANCSIRKPLVNGMCGKEKNSCVYGQPKLFSSTQPDHNWQCSGRNGGNDAPCRTSKDYSPDKVTYVTSGDQLSDAIRKAKAGEIIALANGSYGLLKISRSPSKTVSIVAVSGAKPVLTGIEVTGSNWRFSGLHIKPRFPDVRKAVVLNKVRNILIENSYINFAENIDGWDKEDWVSRTDTAIAVYESTHITIKDNIMKNVRHGILGTLSHGEISGNIIDGFRGDGMQFSGSSHGQIRIENNVIKNVYRVDKAHNDGIQFYTYGHTSGKRRTRSDVGKGVISNVIIRGNKIIQHEKINRPYIGLLQGIGCFDGTFKDWIIEDNIVVVGHWHGISTYGVENMTIRNNTVLDITKGKPTPWIKINSHKNGTLPVNGIVERNIAPAYTSKPSVTQRDNITVRFDEYDWYFSEWANGVVRLKKDSVIRGAGVR